VLVPPDVHKSDLRGVKINDLREDVGARLRRVHQRMTPKRAAIVDVLAAAARPFSLPEILAARTGSRGTTTT